LILDKQKFLRFLPAMLWMAVIFSFSAEDAAASSQSSGNTLEFLMRLFDVDAAEDTVLYNLLILMLRKSAHLLLYTVLGILLFFAVSGLGHVLHRSTVLVTGAIGILYAVTDEIHQYFVPGRACQWQDMLIDSTGVCLGICIMLLLHWFADRIRRHRAE